MLVCCVVALAACGGGGEDAEPTPTPTPTPTPQPEPTPEPVVTPEYFSTGFMKGSTMSFASYLQRVGLTYREGGAACDPYKSMQQHGANIVRLQLNFEAFPKYNGVTIDWATWARVVEDAKKAQANRLDVLLTLKPDADDYSSSSTVAHNRLPAAWKGLTEAQLGEKLYQWVYTTLENLHKEGIYPRVVAVGNEVNIGFLMEGSANDAARTGRLLAYGFKAVRDYGKKYNPNVQTLLHIANPSKVYTYAKNISDAGGSDFDLIGISWYPGKDIGHTNPYQTIENLAKMCKSDFKAQAVILETAYSFTTGNDASGKWMGDWCNNSYNYPDWDDAQNAVNYTPQKQRAWLRQLAEELKRGEGAGLITWGTESLPDLLEGKAEGHGLGLYTYPAEWAYGSTWENNSYWDFTNQNNLHEGIDWMKDVE